LVNHPKSKGIFSKPKTQKL